DPVVLRGLCQHHPHPGAADRVRRGGRRGPRHHRALAEAGGRGGGVRETPSCFDRLSMRAMGICPRNCPRPEPPHPELVEGRRTRLRHQQWGCGMMRTIVLAALLTGSLAATASAAGIAGYYKVEGTNADGSPYQGVA